MEGVLGGLGRGRDVGINQMRLSHRRNVGHCPGGAEREGRRWEEESLIRRIWWFLVKSLYHFGVPGVYGCPQCGLSGVVCGLIKHSICGIDKEYVIRGVWSGQSHCGVDKDGIGVTQVV